MQCRFFRTLAASCPTLEVAGVPAAVEAAEGVSRTVDVGLPHAPAVGLHAVARGQVRQVVHRRAAAPGQIVVVVVVVVGG